VDDIVGMVGVVADMGVVFCCCGCVHVVIVAIGVVVAMGATVDDIDVVDVFGVVVDVGMGVVVFVVVAVWDCCHCCG